MKSKTGSFKELGVQWVGIELNNTCNIKCTFCPVSHDELKRPINNRLMPYWLVERVIEEIGVDGSLEHVILNNYGEPFLYPKFHEVLKLCKDNSIRVRFGTNGTHFNDDNIDLIRLYEPEEIVISIQYFMREKYKEVKGTKIDYDVWLDGIANFIKIICNENLETRIQLAIAANYNNSFRNRVLGLRTGDRNLPYPGRIFFSKLDSFIRDFCEKRIGISYDPRKIQNNRSKNTYDKYYPINDRISFELKSFFDSTNFYKFKESNTVSCLMPYLIINSAGNVLLCCADYQGKTAIGDARVKGVKEILIEAYDIFTNKNNEKALFEICRRCRGERTFRGLVVKKGHGILANWKRNT